jgi:hypothetical protein
MQWKRERGRVLDRSFGEVVVIQKKRKKGRMRGESAKNGMQSMGGYSHGQEDMV